MIIIFAPLFLAPPGPGGWIIVFFFVEENETLAKTRGPLRTKLKQTHEKSHRSFPVSRVASVEVRGRSQLLHCVFGAVVILHPLSLSVCRIMVEKWQTNKP